MSGDRPGGPDLLAFAAKVLRTEILAHVPPEKKLETLMVLRAMAIAERECRAPDPATQTGRALSAFYGGGEEGSDPETAAALSGRLAADIRAGACDPAERARAVHALLLEDVTARLRIANPGYLEGAMSAGGPDAEKT